MKARSVGINAVLNVTRVILSLIAPLITYPYVSRVLGAENLGKVNYVNSIVTYFVLLAGLGISTYGVREGAKERNNSEHTNNLISECFSIGLVMAVFSYFTLACIVLFLPVFSGYRVLFIIESALIAFDILGIEWVNTIFEDYLYITIRTIVVYAFSILAIFAFIHNKNDYYFYAIVNVCTTGLVSVLNWFHCKKNCKIRLRFSKNTKNHIKPILVFFANKLAVTLYVNSDITMLGYMVGDCHVGIYSVAVKIYTIVKNMIAAIYAVTIPQLAMKIGIGDKKGYRFLFTKLCSFMTLALLPVTVGMFVLSSSIISLMFGEEYNGASICLRILSVGLLFAIFGGIVTSVYNVTMNLEKRTLQGTILAAVSNIVLNIWLVPTLHEVGASITTVVAEFVTFIYCFVCAKGIREMIGWQDIRRNLLHALIGCMEIVVTFVLLNKIISSDLLLIAFSIVSSIIIYGVTLIVVKNEFSIMLLEKMKK